MPPPRGGGALLRNLSDNYAHSGLSNSAEKLTPEEQAKAELNANILAGGGLGLDPENDPIVATTDWGLDIKFHNAGEWTSTGYKADQMSSNGNVSTSALNGYCYFTGGTYGGVSLKWVIIGYSPTVITSTSPIWAKDIGIPDTTDAGNALKSASSKGTLIGTSYKVNPIYTNAVSNSEIPAGCVLCISEKNLLNADYNNDSYYTKDSSGYFYGARWSLSELRTTMSNLCNSGIAGFDTIRAKIKTVSLNQYYYRSSNGSSGAIAKDTATSDKFFALANSTYATGDAVHYDTSTYPQNYRLETYLGATYASHASKRISYTHNTTTAYYWWLRSGYSSIYERACIVDKSGSVSNDYVYHSIGVRPAFVLNVCT